MEEATNQSGQDAPGTSTYERREEKTEEHQEIVTPPTTGGANEEAGSGTGSSEREQGESAS